MNEYYIWVENESIPVSEPVYKAYWKGRRKERYFVESDIHNQTFYYDALDTEDMNGSEMFSDHDCLTVEETVLQKLEFHQLWEALKQLPVKDYDLICRLYFYGESLRSISKRDNISVSTLHYRHQKILQQLKKFMKNSF